MLDPTIRDAALLLSILQERNPDKARRQYLKAWNFPEFDDQAVYELIEDRVFDSIMRGSQSVKEVRRAAPEIERDLARRQSQPPKRVLSAPVVEIESELAQRMLLLLKKGIRKSKGGQRNTRHQKLSKRTLVSLARENKARLITEGMTATQAHLQAADEAEDEGRQRGLEFNASYIAREMDRSPPLR